MFVVIFLARVPSIAKKLLNIVRNQIKKESWQLVRNKKVIQSQNKSKKCPKISKFLI